MATALEISGMVCVSVLLLPFWVFWAWMMIRWRRQYLELVSQRSDRLKTLLSDWAKKENYTILFQEELSFWSTPFIPSNNRVDYRVIVEDAQGRRRRGWVRFGGWPLGIFSQRVKVVWEEPQPAQETSSSAVTDPRDDPLWDDWLDHRMHPRR
jgi:hypothetical protein